MMLSISAETHPAQRASGIFAAAISSAAGILPGLSCVGHKIFIKYSYLTHIFPPFVPKSAPVALLLSDKFPHIEESIIFKFVRMHGIRMVMALIK